MLNKQHECKDIEMIKLWLNLWSEPQKRELNAYKIREFALANDFMPARIKTLNNLLDKALKNVMPGSKEESERVERAKITISYLER